MAGNGAVKISGCVRDGSVWCWCGLLNNLPNADGFLKYDVLKI